MTDNTFIWNDELAMEYAMTYAGANYAGTPAPKLSEWKQSKLAPPPTVDTFYKNKMIKCSSVCYKEPAYGEWQHYTFSVSKLLSKEQQHIVKAAIVKALNEDTVENQSKDDIIAFGKRCFYNGFNKGENDDANCYTAWREEAFNLINTIPKTDTVVEDNLDNKLFYFEVVAVSGHNKHLGYEVNVGKMKYMTAWDSNGEPKLTSGNFIECGENLKRQIVFPNPYGIYTKQEVDAMIDKYGEECFDAGGEGRSWRTYPTYQDYKNYLQSLPENQHTEADTGKEWEIQCLVSADKNYWRGKNGRYHSGLFGSEYSAEEIMAWPEFKYIHSVLRKKDNCVFTVGDEVNYGTIEKMIISWVGLEVQFTNGSGATLASIEKLPPKEQSKPVLFTTEQYKEIWDMIFSQTGFPPYHPKTKRNV